MKIKTKEEFIEWVWLYGSGKEKILDSLCLGQGQKEVFLSAWQDADRLIKILPENSNCSKVDDLIGSYYSKFNSVD